MWKVFVFDNPARVHVAPVRDLIVHELGEDCVCGPAPEPVEDQDGVLRWMYSHHALDGRE